MAIDMNEAEAPAPAARPGEQVRDTRRTDCCIVGGGPAGVLLALLLARQGIDVILLEKHGDFDRDFRGDTIHPAGMELLDQIGLAAPLLRLPHAELRTMSIATPSGALTIADFRRLPTHFPFVTVMPQVDFLDFLAGEAARYPHFHLVLRADVRELVEERGVVRGLRYQAPDGRHEVRARLTVGADGRFSRVRRLAGFEPITTSPPIDVLWFRLPRHPDDPGGDSARSTRARSLSSSTAAPSGNWPT